MPEPTTPGTLQAGDPATPPGQAPDTTSSTGQAPAGKTPEDYERMIADLRKENASHRTKLNKFEADEKARADAQLSEIELAKKQFADLQADQEDLAAALLEARVEADLGRFAGKFNFLVPSQMLSKLIDWSQIEVDEETGMPTNIEALLDKLAKSAPEIVKAQQQGSTPARPGAPTIPAMNPGRSSIQQPGQGTPGRIPGWNEVFKRP